MGSLGPNANNVEFKPLDHEEFRKLAHQMVDYIADYYKTVENYPVLSEAEPGYLLSSLPKNAPLRPENFESILADVSKHIVPGMTHWLSPNFFAFFPATVSAAAFVGEMLTTCFNSVGFNWLASPAATELEMVVLDWLASMLKLPSTFMFTGSGGGVLQGTTSEAIICTLVAARDRTIGHDAIGSDGHLGNLVVYGSDQTHSTFTKACKLVGIHPRNIRLIPTTAKSNFALSPLDLRKALQADVAAGMVPLYLCATVGTTSTTAVDPLEELVNVAADYGMWVHVDAAYAGSACICPEFRHHLNGIERADSLSLAPHKWLLTYLDCCCLWVKDRRLLIKALSTNPEYLKNKHGGSNSVINYMDWQIGTGRRFRSLRLWFVLRSYGVENLQEHIRSDIRLARFFECLVRADNRFEVLVPATFALVCFRLKVCLEPKKTEALNRELLEQVNTTGRMYISHTISGGVYMLRFAVGSTLTEEQHVLGAWMLIKERASYITTDDKENIVDL